MEACDTVTIQRQSHASHGNTCMTIFTKTKSLYQGNCVSANYLN